jgi:hypothetical protein
LIPKSVILATLLGGVLRFYDLSVPPLWIDEALLGCGYLRGQEFIGNLLVVHSDFWLRFPYALAGTLTIPAVYYVTKERQGWLPWVVAVFPLFVFWSRLARPYALAGLFVVLAWRWWWVMGVGLLCTPVALLGLKVRKHWSVVLFIAAAALFYFIRSDVQNGKDFDLTFFLDNPRLWYVPLLAGLLYLADYVIGPLLTRPGVVDTTSHVRELEGSTPN